jgi:DeoR family transcriptional regulator, myo-inositol catabolism operon repressor
VIIKRRNGIIEHLRLQHSATLEELCNKFAVSINTIRRDIDELEQEGLLRKVYGGVVLDEKKEVIPVSVREKAFFQEKEKIGQAASQFVNDKDVIIIDSGSTTYHMIKHLKNKNITVITNSINVLNEALPYSNIKLILAGGTLQRETNSFIGKEVVDTLSKFNASTSFIAATGVSINKGITNSSIFEADIKTAIMDSSMKRILLIDHTKFDMVSLVSFARLEYINVLITDKPVSEQFREFLFKHDIKLIITDEE